MFKGKAKAVVKRLTRKDLVELKENPELINITIPASAGKESATLCVQRPRSVLELLVIKNTAVDLTTVVEFIQNEGLDSDLQRTKTDLPAGIYENKPGAARAFTYAYKDPDTKKYLK